MLGSKQRPVTDVVWQLLGKHTMHHVHEQTDITLHTERASI